MRENPRVDTIGFRQDAHGVGKGAHLARVDHHHGQTDGRQGGRHRPLEASRGLEHHQGRGDRLQLRDEGGDPGLVVADGPRLSRRPDGDIERVFRDINPDKQWQGGHRVSPGIAQPCRMRAPRAQTTVRAC
jgi:hypothetical protein